MSRIIVQGLGGNLLLEGYGAASESSVVSGGSGMGIVVQGLGGNLILQGYGPASTIVLLPTLIVEDGTGKVDAESYCSVAYADDYFLRRMVTAWAALSTNQKEANLRLATDYMEQEFRLRWAGYKYTEAQALSWPRWEVYNLDTASGYYGWSNYVGFDTVPDLVKRVCAELALKVQSGPLKTDTGRLKKRTKIGPIDITYADSSSGQQVFYTAIEGWLAPFLTVQIRPGMAHNIRLERA